MKLFFTVLFLSFFGVYSKAQELESPDHRIKLNFKLAAGTPIFEIWYDKRPVILESKLGLAASDYTPSYQLKDSGSISLVSQHYQIKNAKKYDVRYSIRKVVLPLLKDLRQVFLPI